MNAIEHLLEQPAAQAIGWALLQFVWQGALVGLLSAAALFALRRSAADVRYVVATIGLSLMLTMPAVTALQAWRSMADGTASADAGSGSLAPAATVRDTSARVEDSVSPDDRRASRQCCPTACPIAPRASSSNWARAMLVAWLSGVVILTLRLLAGWIWVQRLRSRGTAPGTSGVAADGRQAFEAPPHCAADSAARVFDGRRADRDRVAPAGGADAGERAGRDGAAAARSDPRARARAHQPPRLPRQPAADARRDAALLSSRGLVAVAPDPGRARELLR